MALSSSVRVREFCRQKYPYEKERECHATRTRATCVTVLKNQQNQATCRCVEGCARAIRVVAGCRRRVRAPVRYGLSRRVSRLSSAAMERNAYNGEAGAGARECCVQCVRCSARAHAVVRAAVWWGSHRRVEAVW